MKRRHESHVVRNRPTILLAALTITSTMCSLRCSRQDQPASGTSRDVARVTKASDPAEPPPTTASVAASSPGGKAAFASCEACTASECPDPAKAVGEHCTSNQCDALRRCIARARCDKKALEPATRRIGMDVRFCYCGDDVQDANLGACFQSTGKDANAPHGACRTEIEKLAGATAPLEVGARFFDIETPLGAFAQLEACQNTLCYKACF